MTAAQTKPTRKPAATKAAKQSPARKAVLVTGDSARSATPASAELVEAAKAADQARVAYEKALAMRDSRVRSDRAAGVTFAALAEATGMSQGGVYAVLGSAKAAS